MRRAVVSCYRGRADELIGNLRKDVFEGRTLTGSRLFASLGSSFTQFFGKSSLQEKGHLAVQFW